MRLYPLLLNLRDIIFIVSMCPFLLLCSASCVLHFKCRYASCHLRSYHFNCAPAYSIENFLCHISFHIPGTILVGWSFHSICIFLCLFWGFCVCSCLTTAFLDIISKHYSTKVLYKYYIKIVPFLILSK